MKKKIFNQKYSMVFILIAMMIVCSLLSSAFFTVTNLTNILKQVSIVTICAFAQGMIIITGNIDLSIGYLASMAGCYACIVYLAVGNLFIAFIVGVLIGAAVGFVNGLFIAHFKLPAFIVTLAMQTICLGAIDLYTQGQNIYQIKGFNVLGQGKVGPIPVTVVFMLIMLALTFVILKYTKFGRYLYAIGGNSAAANAAGIPVTKILWIAYIISGMYAAVAGIVLMGRLNAGIPSQGAGYETDAITATVIGGTGFSGGTGTAVGTFLGSLIIGILNNIMNLMGVDSFLQMIIKGFIIIGAVLADTLTKSRGSSIRIMAPGTPAKSESSKQDK